MLCQDWAVGCRHKDESETDVNFQVTVKRGRQLDRSPQCSMVSAKSEKCTRSYREQRRDIPPRQVDLGKDAKRR